MHKHRPALALALALLAASAQGSGNTAINRLNQQSLENAQDSARDSARDNTQNTATARPTTPAKPDWLGPPILQQTVDQTTMPPAYR